MLDQFGSERQVKRVEPVATDSPKKTSKSARKPDKDDSDSETEVRIRATTQPLILVKLGCHVPSFLLILSQCNIQHVPSKFRLQFLVKVKFLHP